MKLPFYMENQYDRLLETVSDPEYFAETWQEWFTNYDKFKSEMLTRGFQCEEVLVDVEELNDYCILNDLENNQANRELFTLHVSAQR